MISRRKRMWGRCMIILTEASMPSTKVKTRVDLVMIVSGRSALTSTVEK